MALYKKLQTIKTGLGLSNRALGRIFGYSVTHISSILASKVKSIKHYEGKSFDKTHLDELERIVCSVLGSKELDLLPDARKMVVETMIKKDYTRLTRLLRVFVYLESNNLNATSTMRR